MMQINLDIMEKTIAQDKPFGLQIADLYSLTTDPFDVFSSGVAYKVISCSGYQFKLRVCKDVESAINLDQYLTPVLRFFPTYHGRDYRYLLFDWVHNKAKITNTGYTVGRVLGWCYQNVPANKSGNSIWADCEWYINELKAVLPSKVYEKAQMRLNDLKSICSQRGYTFEYKSGITDVTRKNFVHDGNQVLYIDEGGVGECPKGLPIIKFFDCHRSYLINQSTFWEGFNEFYSGSFFIHYPLYQDLLLFLNLLRKNRERIEWLSACNLKNNRERIYRKLQMGNSTHFSTQRHEQFYNYLHEHVPSDHCDIKQLIKMYG